MEKPRLEVVILSDERPVCLKRLMPDLEEHQPANKRLRAASPVHPMEWEPSPQPHGGRYAYYDDGLVASTLACPPVRPLSTHLQRKPVRRAPYDPNDFTSDELDPAFEWPRESPPARKCKKPVGRPVAILRKRMEEDEGQFVTMRRCLGLSGGCEKDGAEVPLLQSILGQFPLGLRVDKLVTLMWKEHKVHLWTLSMQRGYKDILQFLKKVPRVRISVSKGGSRYLVHMV